MSNYKEIPEFKGCIDHEYERELSNEDKVNFLQYFLKNYPNDYVKRGLDNDMNYYWRQCDRELLTKHLIDDYGFTDDECRDQKKCVKKMKKVFYNHFIEGSQKTIDEWKEVKDDDDVWPRLSWQTATKLASLQYYVKNFHKIRKEYNHSIKYNLTDELPKYKPQPIKGKQPELLLIDNNKVK